MKKDTRLNLKQIRILEDYFKRSMDGETMEAVAKDHGINRKTLSQWKNTHHGEQLYDKYISEVFGEEKPLFFKKVKEGMMKNSYKHLELYAKVTGMLAPQKQEVVNIDETRSREREGFTKEDIAELEEMLKEDYTSSRVN